MHEDLQTYIDEIEQLLKEVDRYKTFKKNLLQDLKNLTRQYENEVISYKEYERLKFKLLSGKPKEEQVEYYNANILLLARKIEYLNTQIFTLIYDSKIEAAKTKIAVSRQYKESPKTQTSQYSTPQNIARNLPLNTDVIEEVIETKPTGYSSQQSQKQVKIEPINVEELGEEKAENVTTTPRQILQVRKIERNSAIPVIDEALEEGVQNLNYEYGVTPKPLPRKQHLIPKPRKKGLKTILSQDNNSSIKRQDVNFRGILSFTFIKEMINRMRDKEEMIAKDTKRGKSLLDFHGMAEMDFESESKTNPNLLVKQATQLKELLKNRNIKIYNPSMIGTLANLSVRRLSIFLIDQFPDFFKQFYLTLRYANIKLLSNTYVNIMVFLSLMNAMIFGTIAAMFAIAQSNPVFLIISKTFLMATLGVIICCAALIYYPHMKIKERIKSINTNLPFAIDHMSSIVASGVPPAVMFRLISESKEYGEVSLEIEKASNFIDVFGYDLLTAIKSVSATTPSPQLKEFFDGLVSTIETGGSLKNYLTQKSQESMLSYKIERQKYVETIATYSDIYTGVLIAAPLFFVSALSLVSILGGKIGAYDVDTVISFGTYIIIPLMNVAFIIFLEFNQPDV